MAQPFEVAPTFVYLASDDSRHVTGQVLHGMVENPPIRSSERKLRQQLIVC